MFFEMQVAVELCALSMFLNYMYLSLEGKEGRKLDRRTR